MRRRLGVPATIVMPATTPAIKVSQTESHGAEVILFGDMFDEAYAEALRLSDARGLTFVHPFDDIEVMAGQGTVALELLADAPEIDTLIVPIGGGGLISGIGVAARALKPDIAADRRAGRALSRACTPNSPARPCPAPATRSPRASRSRRRAC